MKIYSEIYPDGIDQEFTIKVGNTRITKTLGIIVTNHCNAECDFCCKNSSPRDKTNIKLEDCIRLIEEAKDIGFQQIGFSGGEVMLDYQKLITLSELCYDLGLSFTIATNGFWAYDKEKGRTKMKELKKNGLVVIQASFDESHAEYIKASAFKNLLELAIEENVYLELNSSYYKNGKRIHDYFPGDLISKFKIKENPAVRSGRGTELDESKFEFMETIPSSNCPRPFQITVDYDGNIYPCCSVSGFNNNIKLSDLKKGGVQNSITNLKSNYYLYLIQRFGFKGLIDSEIKTENGETPKFLTVCDVCNYVSKNEDLFNKYIDNADNKMKDELLKKLEDITLIEV